MGKITKPFAGKVVAITGASSGIGKALAIVLAQKGASLALADINSVDLLKTSLSIGDQAPVHTTTVDVSDCKAVHKWADDVAAHYGQINIIINNAGLYLKGNIEESSYDEIQELLSVNLHGVIYGTKAFLPYLRASGAGHIVNMSSVFGLISMPTSGIYCASKFAIRGFTECLQQELELAGDCITTTCVFPGGVKTNIVRNGRIAVNSHLYNQNGVIAKAERDLHLTPEKAALVIVDAILKKKKHIIIGKMAHLLNITQRIFPTGYQRLTKRAVASKKY